MLYHNVNNNTHKHRKNRIASSLVMEQWIVCAFQKICHNRCLETSRKMKHPIYIAIQLLVDWIAYQLPLLVNKYLEFSMVNGFVSVIFIKTINCVGKPLDCHLKWLQVGSTNYVNTLYGQPISISVLRHFYRSVFANKTLLFD